MLVGEQQFFFKDAAKVLPLKTPSSLLRLWALTGRNGIKLEAYRRGKFWYTSLEAVARFDRAVTERAMATKRRKK